MAAMSDSENPATTWRCVVSLMVTRPAEEPPLDPVAMLPAVAADPPDAPPLVAPLPVDPDAAEPEPPEDPARAPTVALTAVTVPAAGALTLQEARLACAVSTATWALVMFVPPAEAAEFWALPRAVDAVASCCLSLSCVVDAWFCAWVRTCWSLASWFCAAVTGSVQLPGLGLGTGWDCAAVTAAVSVSTAFCAAATAAACCDASRLADCWALTRFWLAEVTWPTALTSCWFAWALTEASCASAVLSAFWALVGSMVSSCWPAVTCWPRAALTETMAPVQFCALTTVVVAEVTLPEAVATEEMPALLTATVRTEAAWDVEPAAVTDR